MREQTVETDDEMRFITNVYIFWHKGTISMLYLIGLITRTNHNIANRNFERRNGTLTGKYKVMTSSC
mgnify:CR=1 FL=1